MAHISGTFATTMENGGDFRRYSQAMAELGNAAQVIAAMGGDPRSVDFIAKGMEGLALQLRGYADDADGRDDEITRLIGANTVERGRH